MKQAKHTPAPWIYDEENDGGIYSRTGAYVGAAVKLGTDAGDANARLMAAAPELLHWATEYTSNVTPGESATDYAIRMDAAFNGLLAAIAKAGGAA